MGKINRIRKEGGSRVMTVTCIIPCDWSIVSTKVTRINANVVNVKIEKVQ